MFPNWVYFAVAAAIALLAFALAQFKQGLGMPFVILASTFWAAYVRSRTQR